MPDLQSDESEESVNQSLEDAFREVEDKGSEPEAPAPELPKRPKPSVLTSLHRREQKLQQERAEWQKATAERERALAEREARFKQGKYSPFEALKEIGYEDPAKFIELISENGGEWTPEQKKLAELEEWKSKQMAAEEERQRQAQEDQQAHQHKQLVDAWHADIAKSIKGSEKWSKSLLSIPGTEASVFQVIEQHYANTGERLDYDTACEDVAQRMDTEVQNAIRTVAGTARGLELIKQYLASLEPQKPQRGKQTAQQRGLTPNVRNSTRSDPLEELDLNAALDMAAGHLTRVSRQG